MWIAISRVPPGRAPRSPVARNLRRACRRTPWNRKHRRDSLGWSINANMRFQQLPSALPRRLSGRVNVEVWGETQRAEALPDLLMVGSLR